MNATTPRYRRGDPSPVDAGLVFNVNNHGRDEWVTPAKLAAIKEREHASYLKRKASQLQRQRERRQTDPQYRTYQIRQTVKWQKKNREKMNAAQKRWLAKPGSLEKKKESYDNWVAKPAGRSKRREVTARYRATVNGTIINRVRSRIAVALRKGGTKSVQTLELIGCSISELRAHLESQFLPEMSWANTHEWEIDHIRPLAGFCLEDPEQQKLAFHWSNQRPMWTPDNRSKSDFIEHNGQTIRARELRKIIPFQKAA